MSELKVHTIYTPMDDVAHDEKGKILEGQEVYLKSEADKVIAEKDKVIAYAKAIVLVDIKIIRQQKYKRCLAMSEMCNANYFRQYMFKPNFWKRWHKRWLELAEKFKPNEEAK